MQKSTKKISIRSVVALVFILTVLCALTLCASAETVEYFYINSETGDDHYGATSADDALKTFTQACRMAEKSGADRAVIVITNAYKFPSTVKEIAHTVPIEITTNDGTTDFAKTVGAKLTFGNGLRYYLNGPTIFKDITVEYTKSIVFVAQYNPITFDENVNFVPLSDNPAGIYLVGGWQSPLDDFVTDMDTHITIKSGEFAYVIGGSRQIGTGSKGTTYTGTHYIDISGGKIDKFLGGSYAGQICDSAVINVTGGEFNIFYVAGDATRRFEKDATVTLSGGTIKDMHVNNVLGAATVYLKGAKVDSMVFEYAKSDFANTARKNNKDDILYYDANYYTQAQIDSYSTGFTAVENITTIYAKQGATGSGASESDPASFEAAFEKASDTNSVVAVIGTVTLENFTETAHSGTVTVKGASTSSSVVLNGTYTMNGKTEFKNIKLGGTATVNAKNGTFATGEGVSTSAKLNIEGSAELTTGSFGNITNAGNVVISGATVQNVTGGTSKIAFEINSGKVGVVKTTDTSIADAKVSINGGTVEKVIFNNVTASLECLIYGGTVSAYEVMGNNVKGALKIDEEKVSMDTLGAAAALFEVDNTVVFFLKDGATGNGTSVTAAGSTLDAAYAAIGNNKGVIVVCGTYTIPAAFVAPAHTGDIIITSKYDGVDYRKTDAAKIVIKGNFYCGGNTVIDGIHLLNEKSYGGIFAAYNDLTITSDILCEFGGTTTTYPSIVGGTYQIIENVSGSVTINGGTWQRVRLGNSAAVPVNADLKMTINGGTFIEKITLGTNTTHSGNLELVINGGKIQAGIVGASMPTGGDYSYTGKMAITINGGTIYGKIAPRDNSEGTFHGEYVVTLNGGDLSHVTDILGTENVTGDMTSTVYVSENLDVNEALKGTYSFTSLVRESPNGADPWLFEHDGYYYYIATAAGNGLQLVKAANLGDILTATSTQIYKPAKGHEYSAHLWSPEIHYFSAEEIGEQYAGWYCFLGSQPDDAWHAENGQVDDPAGFGEQRAYVIKCLDGDNLLGKWGHPLTGEVNVPQKIQFPDSDFNVNELTGGCSVITINGVKYITFISEVGRETSGTSDYNFYQTINIAKFTNPWTIEGQPKVICKPEYDWEKGGSENGIHPQVVEGATAVYGPNGEVYIIYSGSGYWTAKYQLGQLTYIGGPNGDPTDINSWSKKPTSIFSQSAELTGCGHASYVKDHTGQGWICYHAYPNKSDSRRAYVEPYYFTEEGVVIGNRSGHPAPMSTVYTSEVNPASLATKISGFDKQETAEAKFEIARKYEGSFTDVTTNHWFYTYVKNAYELKLANGTSQTKFSPDNTFTVAQALTAATNIHTAYYGKTVRAAAQGEAWYVPYVEYCVQSGIITEGQFADLNANITRGDMATVFANILPAEEYAAVKTGSNPDVTSDMSCYSAVMKLYQAGIVGGDSGTGNYRPNDSIKRSEACVIFTRIAMQTARAF